MERKVIIVQNTTTREIQVFSSKKKVFAAFEKHIPISYVSFCREVSQNGFTIKQPAWMGLEENLKIKQHYIK